MVDIQVELPPAHSLARAWQGEVIDRVVLDYEARFLRRRRLVTEGGAGIVVDLAETSSLDEGDALILADGRAVAVIAAAEDLVAVSGDLARLAWHIGNRHTPCAIMASRLVIRRDHVIEAMLTRLGATLVPVREPFRPEGGAYGHGRTLGHAHAHDDGDHQAHSHGHDHGHDHDAGRGDAVDRGHAT